MKKSRRRKRERYYISVIVKKNVFPHVKQGSDKQEVCLWREAAIQLVNTGDQVTITHLKVQQDVHSTMHTTFKVLPCFCFFVLFCFLCSTLF